MAHYRSIGGIEAQGMATTWFIREHGIEYLARAFAGEEIESKTWAENVRPVSSLRESDGQILVRGETDWVFVDSKTGTPLAIPEKDSKIFDLSPDNPRNV